MKRAKVVSLILTACLFLSGCGNQIPQMTEEEQEVITEYAASTFLKYTNGYDDKIYKEVEETTESEKAEEPEEVAVEETTPEETTEEAPELTVSENEIAPVQAVPLAEFLGASAFTMEYEGIEICDSYSGAAEGELAFGMTATSGKKLLITKFAVTNPGEAEQVLDLFSKNVKAKVSAAGMTQNALLTMLDNDLLTADTTIAAGESRIFVIAVEIPQEKEAEVTGVSVALSYGGKSADYMFGN